MKILKRLEKVVDKELFLNDIGKWIDYFDNKLQNLEDRIHLLEKESNSKAALEIKIEENSEEISNPIKKEISKKNIPGHEISIR